MARFLDLDVLHRRTVLLQKDSETPVQRALAIRTDTIQRIVASGDKRTDIMLDDGNILRVDASFDTVLKELNEDPGERAASNLLRIWEILRARLH